MVATMVDNETRQAPAPDPNVVCPHCGRFVAERRLFVAIPPHTVFARLKCPRCGNWRWVDLATGRVVHTPPLPPA